MSAGGMQVSEDETANYEVFRECIAEPILRRLAPKVEVKSKRKTKRKSTANLVKTSKVAGARVETIATNDDHQGATSPADELGDFVEYIATGIFISLPAELRTLSYESFSSNARIEETYSTPLSPDTIASLASSVASDLTDTLATYLGPSGTAPEDIDIPLMLLPVFTSYVTSSTTPPPVYAQTRASACELCSRSWINLSYHHLIPRSTHAKVLKRGWHPEWRLNSVAWLCRQCHSFVHGLASNEELAREMWSMDLIWENRRDECESWVKWVGRIRWKKS